jgi:phosphoribosyl-AMP cyclohydrolase
MEITSIDEFIAGVRFDANGLVAVIARDDSDKEVLMLAYMNAATLRQTLQSGLMTYWSRSREEVWVKGATSGHYQYVQGARLDCDSDALLFDVIQDGGGACHTGRRSCFFKEVPFTRAAAPDSI